MPSNTDKFIKASPNWVGAIGSGGVADGTVTTIPLVSVTGLPTDTAVQITIDRVDANGTATPAKSEVLTGVVSSTNLINCIRGVEGTAQGHSAGAVVEVMLTSAQWNSTLEGILVEHNQDGTHDSSIARASDIPVKATGAEIDTGANDAKFATPKAIADSILKQYPEGAMLNGKIVPSVATNNLTVALKTKAGTDPSASDPVYAMIGGTLRSITSALSVTKNAATNWFNAGSSELATKEIDYFVYLGYNATDGVTIGFARIPYATQYGDFSATTTDEKYCGISTIINAASTDYYNVIGRFAATLSAGTAYTWTVPTFTAKNLIQRPIFTTRWLDWTATMSVDSGTVPTYSTDQARYKIKDDTTEWEVVKNNTSGGTAGSGADKLYMMFPFSHGGYIAVRSFFGYGQLYEESGSAEQVLLATQTANKCSFWKNAVADMAADDQSSANRYIIVRGNYEI